MHSIKYSRLLKLPLQNRGYSKNAISSAKFVVENLSPRRSLVRVSGDEVYGFLQGLITNDIRHVETASGDNAMFTMFLNKQGRVLYDAIIYKCRDNDKTCFIDCDRSIDNELKRHLLLFRVRKKISIDIVNDDFNIWAGFADCRNESVNKLQPIQLPKMPDDRAVAYLDPRLNQLGLRFVTPSNFQIKDFQTIADTVECSPSTDDYDYNVHRYVHGVSEGSEEIPPTKTFPFEANCDYLHGISFHKGCYLGQEFTARTYHTGVIRKRIMPIVIESNGETKFDFDTPIRNENGQLLGKLKAVQRKHAIGSLKVDQALSSKCLTIGDVSASTHRPNWWPIKL